MLLLLPQLLGAGSPPRETGSSLKTSALESTKIQVFKTSIICFFPLLPFQPAIIFISCCPTRAPATNLSKHHERQRGETDCFGFHLVPGESISGDKDASGLLW